MQTIGKKKMYFVITAKYETETSDKNEHTMFLYEEYQYPDLVDIVRFIKSSIKGAQKIWVLGISPMPKSAFMRWAKALKPKEDKPKIITG